MLQITSTREGCHFKNQGEPQSLLPGPHPPHLQVSAVVTYMILRQDPTIQSAWPWDPSKYWDYRCVCARLLSLPLSFPLPPSLLLLRWAVILLPQLQVPRYKHVLLHWSAFSFFLETVFCVTQSGLNLQSSYFHDPSAGIPGMCQHPWTLELNSLGHL